MTNSSKNASKRLLLFGGAFDPPHKGHVNLLENAVAAAAPTCVLVVPSGTAPHKRASGTPWALRAAMCRCFLPVFPRVEISDMEQRRSGKSYTYDTVRQIEQKNSDSELFLLLGDDMLESFFTWYRWRELLRRTTLVVAPRKAGELPAMQAVAEKLQQAGGRILFAPGPVVVASSTGIRAALAAGSESAFALLPLEAAQVIRENGLYTTPPPNSSKNMAE